MSYQFVVQLPKDLEAAYRAGKVIVDSGVARQVGGPIAGHLEMVAPHAINALGVQNPYIALASTGLKTINAVNDSRKLNKVISLTQEIKTLSTVNLALSSATLGVAGQVLRLSYIS